MLKIIVFIVIFPIFIVLCCILLIVSCYYCQTPVVIIINATFIRRKKNNCAFGNYGNYIGFILYVKRRMQGDFGHLKFVKNWQIWAVITGEILTLLLLNTEEKKFKVNAHVALEYVIYVVNNIYTNVYIYIYIYI